MYLLYFLTLLLQSIYRFICQVEGRGVFSITRFLLGMPFLVPGCVHARQATAKRKRQAKEETKQRVPGLNGNSDLEINKRMSDSECNYGHEALHQSITQIIKRFPISGTRCMNNEWISINQITNSTIGF